MLIVKGLLMLVLLSALVGCSASSSGWSWQHPQGLDPAQRERDLADCMYYASITDPRAFGADKPVQVQEFDQPVQECMALRGWIFVESTSPFPRRQSR
ncbi:MAG: hypothetical protein U1D97_09570 [Desulfuromonadales bacterium]|nr:hypothetical protein [Desulfuromonadales bacterium]